MKKSSMFILTLAVVALAIPCGAFAGQGDQRQDQKQERPRTTTGSVNTPPVDTRVDTRVKEQAAPDDKTAESSDPSAEFLSKRRADEAAEEAAVVPYYNNFMTTYRLGPEDIISVSVFGQERYSRAGIVVPPDGRISYHLIPEGILVVGKTTQQVAEEISKKLDEYIIDPKVTVTLEKAQSARYGVIGDVAQPGIRLMTRRLTVYEAVTEAGGVLPTGDKKKVFVLRRQPDGNLLPTRVDLAAIEKGRATDAFFLAPGDQIVVPGNRLKKVQQVANLFSVLSFARIFTGGW